MTDQPLAPASFAVEVRPRSPEPRHTPVGAIYHAAALYFLQGTLSPSEAHQIAAELLCDPVNETYCLSHGKAAFTDVSLPFIDVLPLPGVTDPVAENLVQAASWIGIAGLDNAATGMRFYLHDLGDVGLLKHFAEDQFCNTVVQRYALNTPIEAIFAPPHVPDRTVEIIPVQNRSDAQLIQISAERRLSLDIHEMRAIRSYFEGEGRDPTDVELEMLAQTWSEHCVHKTFRARIEYQEGDAPPQVINGLLRTYIRAATEQIKKPWVHSAFVDNAGIVKFDEQYDLAFKVETHNHPSALEPFGGANTGVGGVVRDILGVSARPIANTDVLCFGDQDLDESQLPKGVLHPRRIQEGVTRGIEDYGNKMGIPTVNGAIFYHPGYTSNPLVFCGCLGILPHNSHPTRANPGDWIVVIGGRTGRDGLRGATFSSMEMDQSTGEIAGSAVQIGHPIHEKQVQEVILRARDARLYSAITDCGAGGLSSAVGEMAKDLGGVVHLEQVPLKYPGLRPWEIWLSEAQERMVLAVPPANWETLRAICEGQDVEATVIGSLEATGRLILRAEEKIVGDLSMNFLHEGIPQRRLKAIWTPPTITPWALPPQSPEALSEALRMLLGHPNIRSREGVIRKYDHEVQGGTAIKPLTGVDQAAPANGAVIVPLDSLTLRGAEGVSPNPRGAALSVGLAPLIGERDPYLMAFAAVDEAFRNLVAMGADPDTVSLLDNFCWGNANLPDRLGSLTRCAQGCYQAALTYQAPFISGKDSLNNEYADETGKRHAIPGTLVISALGIVPFVKQAISSVLTGIGNKLYLLGETREELGASHFALLHSESGGILPAPPENPLAILRALHQAIRAGRVQSAHDPSEGGIGVALMEMTAGGGCGAQIDLRLIPGASSLTLTEAALFSESLCRFIVEVRPEDVSQFEAHFAGLPCTCVGETRAETSVTFIGLSGESIKAAQLSPSLPLPATSERKHSTYRPTPNPSGTPRALILHATGTNRDRDAALACELAGAETEIVHVNQLLRGERNLADYHMLVVPGGFSYGDDLGAGKVWALHLEHRLGEGLQRFIEDGRPVLGICNGFQALVKAGFLPGAAWRGSPDPHPVTLTFNQSGHFECRWVRLQVDPASKCLFTEGIEEIMCPVAHGEGRLAAVDESVLNGLERDHLIPLRYAPPDQYPANPNGSALGIAALCNPTGNVMGLMPHPENHIFTWQNPGWRQGQKGSFGLTLFQNAVRWA
ncbi:MAG: phosphoribosylformylglycinamidine synthase subunit PurL [Anaerolinea sp.]|nr:phosphoribosylformylglycinamidine synthase subunit PurL [Anaerolinea sp.]